MTTEITLEQSIQTVLGLPELNKTETRRNLGLVFAAYRRCKLILKMGIEQNQPRTPAVPGYEYAMDPGLIIAPIRVGGNMPRGFEARNYSYENTLEGFVERVEWKVNMLPELKREIIKRRYLTLQEPLPMDTDVWLSLREDGFAISERVYDRKKAEAMMVLAYAFGVEKEDK